MALLSGGTIICWLLVGIARIQFGEPLNLGGDHLFILVHAKHLIKEGWGRFNTGLGDPAAQDYLRFPLFDSSYQLLLWIITRFTSNVFLAVNVLYVIGISLMFAFCYAALRRLGVRPWLATVAGIAFIISPYFAIRLAGHDTLALYYGVPLGAVIPLLIAAVANKQLRSILFEPFVLVAIVVCSISGLYYAFFAALFIMITALGPVDICRIHSGPPV